MTVTDKDLVERLIRGNLEAFDMIYDMYAGRIYAFSMKYLKSEDEAAELVQSVFMKVWENHKKLDANLSFRSFLFTIAYNEICRSFRRKSYLRKYIEEAVQDGNRSDTSPEDNSEFHSILSEVEKIIASLPEKKRKAFIMCKIDGMPAKEVAAGLGLSPGTVDNYVSSTIKTIRKMMTGESLAVILFTSLFLF